MDEPTKARAKAPPPKDGIECSQCGCTHWHVLRVEHRPGAIARRRECRHCGHRATTIERTGGGR